MRHFLFGIIFTVVVLIAAAGVILLGGYLGIGADQQPSRLEKKFAMEVIDASTGRRAHGRKNPIPPAEENLVAGARLYLDHCAGCHGLPSNPDSQFARSFYPPVPRFFMHGPDMEEMTDMPENKNFYIIEHGIRLTGMPAWNKTLDEGQIWQIVTFLSDIEKLPPAALKVLEPAAAASPVAQ